MPVIREWTESLWGKNSPYVNRQHVQAAPTPLPEDRRVKARMPTSSEIAQLHARDGFHCRFCGIPVVRAEIRKRISAAYPEALPWGRKNSKQHAAFQAMWVQYDHLKPHAMGGNNDLENVVVTCAPCNFGRMSYSLEEVGLTDPRTRAPVHSAWDGLERFRR
jgi:5-methylcytosine-specific restriction endonuclease McrA